MGQCNRHPALRVVFGNCDHDAAAEGGGRSGECVGWE